MQNERKSREYKSFYKVVTGNEGRKCNYPARIDTYGCGCAHDCSYCYAKSLLDFRKLWNPESPSVADLERVKRRIRMIQKERDESPEPQRVVIRLGGMTDCFQPCEKTHRVTYETIKALNEAKIEYLIVTKSDLVADDEYMAVMDKGLAHIQITITTLDDELAKTYEHCSSPTERVKAVEKLAEAGFDVCVRLSPFIPQYMDVDELAKVKCDKILVEFLRVNRWMHDWFDVDYSEYTVKHKGYRHLPLEKKLEYIKTVKGFKEITVCEDEDTAYQYWKYHFNPNKNDCCNLRNDYDY